MTTRVFIPPGANRNDLIEAYKILGYDTAEPDPTDDAFIVLEWKKAKVKKPKATDDEDKTKKPERRTKAENRLRGKNNGV